MSGPAAPEARSVPLALWLREVYGAALRVLETASIMLVHNHPSGNPRPSGEDLALTKWFARAGKILDVPLTDHVILGEPEHLSLVEKGIHPGVTENTEITGCRGEGPRWPDDPVPVAIRGRFLAGDPLPSQDW